MDLEDVREIHQEVLSAWAELFVSDEFTKLELLGRQLTGALANLDEFQTQLSAITGLTGPDEEARRKVEQSINQWKAYFNSYKKLYDKLKVEPGTLNDLYEDYCGKLEAAEAALSASPPGTVNWNELEEAQKKFLDPLEKLQKGKEFVDRYLNEVNKQYVILNKIVDQLELVKLYTSVPRTNEELEFVIDTLDLNDVFRALLQKVGRLNDVNDYKREKPELMALLQRAYNHILVLGDLGRRITNTNFNQLKTGLDNLLRQFTPMTQPIFDTRGRQIPQGQSVEEFEIEKYRSLSALWPFINNLTSTASKMLSAYKALKAKKP